MMGVLRAGAVGYIRKDAEPETLLAEVRAVAQGRTYIDPSIGRQFYRRPLCLTILLRAKSRCSGNWRWASPTKKSHMRFPSVKRPSSRM